MISASHGQPFEHPSGIPIFAMYHPAVALYNPNLRDVLKEDFAKLKNYLDNGGELMKNEKADNSVFSTKTKTDINDILSM